MTLTPKNKQFWTPNRHSVAVSAILPVLIFIGAITLANTSAIKGLTAFVFLFGMLYLYVLKPFLTIKYGDKLKEIKIVKKTDNKIFAIGNKTFKEEQVSKIIFSICVTLFCSIFLGAGLPNFIGTPFEILRFITPYLALHLYCFITDNDLSILKLLKAKGQTCETRWHNTQINWLKRHRDQEEWHSRITRFNESSTNIQGKIARGSTFFVYDD